MVDCDNDPTCKYQWFHGLKSEPKTKQWYCPDSRQKDTRKVNTNTRDENKKETDQFIIMILSNQSNQVMHGTKL